MAAWRSRAAARTRPLLAAQSFLLAVDRAGGRTEKKPVSFSVVVIKYLIAQVSADSSALFPFPTRRKGRNRHFLEWPRKEQPQTAKPVDQLRQMKMF